MNDFSGLDGWTVDHMDQMGAVFFVLIALSFLAGIGTLVYRGIRYASAPPQSSPGVVVTKRSEVRGMSDGPTRTRYYVTFELPDGIPREPAAGGPVTTTPPAHPP